MVPIPSSKWLKPSMSGLFLARFSNFCQASILARFFSRSFFCSILYFCVQSSKSFWFISMNNFNAL